MKFYLINHQTFVAGLSLNAECTVSLPPVIPYSPLLWAQLSSKNCIFTCET